MRFAYLIEPPFNDRDARGEVVGCDIDLARHVFAALGIDAIDFVETEFAQLLPGLADGGWRMTTGLFVTLERQRIASFSRPIWALADGLLVQAGNPLGISGYASAAAHPTCVMAVVRDQIQHRTALSFGLPAERLLIVETYGQAAQAVLAGKASAYASVARAHHGYLAQNPSPALEVNSIPPNEAPPAFGAFAFNKADDGFRQSIDEVLAHYLGSAEHRVMMARYGFSAAEIDQISV